MSASGQVTSANRAFRTVCGVVLSILAGLLLLLAFDILRPRNAPSFGMLLSRAWPELPIVGLCSLSLWAWSRAWRDRPQHAAVARRLRQVGLVFGVVVGMPVALMMVEYCCYEPVKFTYLIYRVEHAASPEAERAAFRLADRWGRVWELNRISEREHLPERVQHLEDERILELEWLENWPSGTPYRAYRKVIEEQNMKVFDHGKRAKKPNKT